MAITAALLNYFVLLPLYSTFMPIEQAIEAFAAFIPFINTNLDAFKNAHLIRVNSTYADVPKNIESKSISIQEDLAQVIPDLLTNVLH